MQFRPSRSHYSPMANHNGSLSCDVKSGSKQVAQITESAANRSIDGVHECCAFNLVHLGDHSPPNSRQSLNFTPTNRSE